MLPYKIRLCRLLLTGLLFCAAIVALAQQKTYQKTTDGILVYPDLSFSGGVQMVKLQVVDAAIIRVVAAPEKKLSEAESLIAVYKPANAVPWTVIPLKDSVALKTKAVTATVSLTTGAVSFYNSKGKRIIAERATGHTLQPAVFQGQPSYAIHQSFETTADDAYYGLGQHQDDVYNYKGRQVSLFQNNTEVAVPFLISAKGYGILWDNYSLAAIGDTRPFRELNALGLYAKNGDEGWLTATYSNDKANPGEAVLARAETRIDMAYLGDSKTALPAEFNPKRAWLLTKVKSPRALPACTSSGLLMAVI